MNYAGNEGVDSIIAAMMEFEERFGERFKPARGWSLLGE